MRRLFFLLLNCIAIFSVWFFITRTPFPSELARETSFELLSDETSTAQIYWKGYDPIGYTETPFNILMVPSLGREASDFEELAEELAPTQRVFLFDPRGLHGEELPKTLTLNDFAEPIKEAVQVTNDSGFPTILIGHALGNRITRVAAYQNPENINAVILLAAGGQVPMEPKAEQALRDIFNPMKSHKDRMKDVEYAFFAEGNEVADHWTRGWHTRTAQAQIKAVIASRDDESWHCAGGVPMLIIQPMQDRIAPIENAFALRDKCPQEVEIVVVENAGHALLPEQPDAVAKAVLAFLAKHHPVETLEP